MADGYTDIINIRTVGTLAFITFTVTPQSITIEYL
jgi:hypothetical protein